MKYEEWSLENSKSLFLTIFEMFDNKSNYILEQRLDFSSFWKHSP